MPLKAEFSSIDFLADKAFLSGFEYYLEAFDYNNRLDEINKLNTSKKRGIRRLFVKKQNHAQEEFIINSEADKILEECKFEITLIVHSDNDFEAMLAFAFSSYLAEKCNGVICAPQTVNDYYNNIKQGISEQIEREFTFVKPDSLSVHPFEKWV